MSPILRIIDANANRAREAFRTLEDLARFRLNDPALSGELKSMRHDLAAAVARLPGGPAALLAWRDTPGDVGTSIKSADEGTRLTPRDIALAAARRAGEALRVLEESFKLPGHAPAADGTPAWRTCEDLRYRLYEVERRVVLALSGGRASQWRLCVLITESLCRRPWLEVARAAITAGAGCLQLREPALADGQLLERARRLLDLARDAARDASRPEPTIIINNRLDVALAAQAHGVHLGVDDLPLDVARRLGGDDLILGASTHDLAEARRAAASSADYCGVGAMFPSTTKTRDLSGPDYLRAYLADDRSAQTPHLAIGGITPANLPTLVALGCRGIAVSSAVCSADDPRAVCEALLAAWPQSAVTNR